MVLIPKGKKDYRGISLVEVMWKVVAAILNRQLTAYITYHDFLHGFRAGRGTSTATLEAKMMQHLSALRKEVLYVIYLDLSKASYALCGPGRSCAGPPPSRPLAVAETWPRGWRYRCRDPP